MKTLAAAPNAYADFENAPYNCFPSESHVCKATVGYSTIEGAKASGMRNGPAGIRVIVGNRHGQVVFNGLTTFDDIARYAVR